MKRRATGKQAPKFVFNSPPPPHFSEIFLYFDVGGKRLLSVFQCKQRQTPEDRFLRHESLNAQTGRGFEKNVYFLIEGTLIESASTCGDVGINGVPF
jgi:hypothetical protein